MRDCRKPVRDDVIAYGKAKTRGISKKLKVPHILKHFARRFLAQYNLVLEDLVMLRSRQCVVLAAEFSAFIRDLMN